MLVLILCIAGIIYLGILSDVLLQGPFYLFLYAIFYYIKNYNGFELLYKRLNNEQNKQML